MRVPTALKMIGRLHGESDLLTLAHAYQLATGHHRKRPPMEKVTQEYRDAKDDPKNEDKKDVSKK